MRKRLFRDLRPGDWLSAGGRESIIVLGAESGWNPGEVTLRYLWSNRTTYRVVTATTLSDAPLWDDWSVVSGRLPRDRAGSR